MEESNVAERIPAETFPPGEFLRDELAERGWTQTELAEIMGRPPRVINEIISGKRSVTPETAKELAAALGTSAQYWMNLETSYQLTKARPASPEIAVQAALRDRFPVREMMRRNWLPACKNNDDLRRSLLCFFDLKSIDDEVMFPHAAKKNHDEKPRMLQYAWLFRVKYLSEKMVVKSYSPSLLKKSLEKLESLLVEPEEVRHVPRILSECGVRYVIVEPMPGSKIDGVCFWIKNNTCPVIGMTLRYDRNDNYWFVLRHEIEHVLHNHGKNQVIIDENIGVDDATSDHEEVLANRAAQEFCVPTSEINDFIARVRPFFSEQKITGFARRISRHPGIVIGQLQRRLDRPDLLNKLKAKIRSHLLSSAVMDGWGNTPPDFKE